MTVAAVSHTAAPSATVNPTTLQKLARCDHFLTGDMLIIASATTVGKLYRVTADGCSCPAGQHGRLTCWHMRARTHLLAEQAARDVVIGGPQTPEELDALEDARQIAAHWAAEDALKRSAVNAVQISKESKRRMSDVEYERILAACDEVTSPAPRRRERVREAF